MEGQKLVKLHRVSGGYRGAWGAPLKQKENILLAYTQQNEFIILDQFLK